MFAGRTKGLKGDGAGMDVRVLPPEMRDSRFERSMGDALRQQNETLEMQEVEISTDCATLALTRDKTAHNSHLLGRE